MSVSRLLAVLNAIGPPVDTVELAEMLWLAGHLPAPAPETAADPAGPDGGAGSQNPDDASRPGGAGGP
ncbi:MAG: hypothetical protein HOW97_40880, partial [Catenulispora sp.]|nr:hypothetical protein [Catenulispora sp.]